jgi:type II secretory pathway component PulC
VEEEEEENVCFAALVRLDSIVGFRFRLCFGNLSFSSLWCGVQQGPQLVALYQNNLTKAEKEEHLFGILSTNSQY